MNRLKTKASAFFYQLNIWFRTFLALIWLPKYFDQSGRRRLAYASGLLVSDLPLISLETVIGQAVSEETTVAVKALSTRPHNCSLFEHFAIAAIAKLVGPKTCIEIGTYDGRSALAIAANVSHDATVYTLNLPPDYLTAYPELDGNFDAALSLKVQSGARWMNQPERDKIRQLYGDSRRFDFSKYFPAQLFFIDGAHDTATVLSDSRTAIAGIDKANGVILWDDAQLYGVPAALKVLLQEGYPVRVIAGTELAVLRFKDGRPLSYPP